jgi:hypothetical protein
VDTIGLVILIAKVLLFESMLKNVMGISAESTSIDLTSEIFSPRTKLMSAFKLNISFLNFVSIETMRSFNGFDTFSIII